MTKITHNYGFTLIEILVTLTLASIVIASLYAALSSIITIYRGASHRDAASNLAYANMRLYADGTIPSWFICNPSNQTQAQTLMNKTTTEPDIPGSTTQTITATAIYGCDEASQGYPIRVVSSVQTSNGIEVSHATYAAY